MSDIGQISLRERPFKVKPAAVRRQINGWQIEIETDFEEYDGERWASYLHHQGLRLDATTVEELQGRSLLGVYKPITHEIRQLF